jgi:2'-5' RNA ligase
MRCFIAVDINEKLMPGIVRLQEGLKGLDTRLVEPENVHFTMKFLGEVDVKVINEVAKRIRHLAESTDAFDITLSGVGAFPSEHFLKVVWIGAEELKPMQTAVNDSLAGLFPKEKPSPHLTLARVRSQQYRDKIRDFITANKNLTMGNMKVSTLKLKKSTLTRNGPVYDDVEVFSLRSATRN